ncbi:MAG: hypothetical protein R3B82_29180 [Sandaracinaceae bacterium]
MTLRRLLALAVMSGLLCASPAFAQSEEDPEPEVSDAGPENLYERLLAVSATGGWDTPFGVIGGGIEFAPIQWINIYAGGGVSRSGGRFTLGVNFRAPIHSTAFGVQLGVSGGPLDHDATGDDPLHRYWEFALFVNAGLNVEYRFDMGVFLRLAGGAEALVAGDVTECRGAGVTSCEEVPQGLAQPFYPWAALSVGYAFEL